MELNTTLIDLFALLVLGFALVAKLEVRGELLLGADLSDEEITEVKVLSEKFVKLDGILKAKIAAQAAPEDSIRVAKETLEGLGRGLLSGNKRFKKALALFISLEDTARRCGLDGYKILAKNYAVIFPLGYSVSRVRAVLNHYQKRHANECRPTYKELFRQQFKKVPEQDLEKVRRLFSPLSISSFDPEGYLSDRLDGRRQSWSLASMPTPNFTSDELEGALDTIVMQVASEAKKSPLWKSMLPTIGDDGTRSKPTKKVSASVFEEYIFRPCKNYRDLLGDILTPARFDAMVEDEQQEDFLHGDKQFYQELIHNRLCASLSDRRFTTTHLMLKLWMETYN